MVIRRAAELQASQSDDVSDGEGVSEVEVIRIGQELGLSPEHLQRAIAETAGARPEQGFLHEVFGPETARASRLVRGDPGKVLRTLERYLVDREFLVVQRRFPDRVVFTRATGILASMGRAVSQTLSRAQPLDVENLDVSCRSLDDGSAWVSIATSLRVNRNTVAASSFVGGGMGATVAGAVLGIAIAPPVALVALPVLGASVFGGRAYYAGVVRDTGVRLESLLDRLEHGELG
jgi:hypothetical protein